MTDFASSQDLVEDMDCTEVQSLCRQINALKYRAACAELETRAFRELAEHIHEVFWMTTPLGDELIYISPAYEAIWGQTCQSLYDDPGRRLAWVYESDREQVLKAFKRDARSGQYDETFRIDRPDGEIRWIRDRAWPVYDDTGQLYRLAGFANDITAHMAEHDRMNELGDTLACRERIEVFAALGAGIAHDMAQPLTAARGHLARSRTAEALATARTAASQADQEIKRAGDIVGHLRNYARQGQPNLSPVRLDDLLADLHQLVDTAIRTGAVNYSVDVDESTAATVIDVDRILVQQILRNLVQNAIDAHAAEPDGKAEPHIEASVRLTDDQHVEFRISDNGPGVAPGDDPFAAFDTQKCDGLGLGLYVGRSLARVHGGNLWLITDHRKWATVFVLRLPCSGQAEQPAGPPPVADVSAVDASRA
ncbi:sensor histidine kinase [Salinisphaera japonica]|uniref:histidine kinase n=1 Tax=Salinisphaera japonica YTM-1 TaxID=1209778 RepID=A0A423PFP9_9GAMM|nr:ATP-binding protein [Salinisphaera japonica]ROO24414.1 hypothetical protein SAJA_14370 [Salinisphaera japonica YTM-1]